MLYKIYCIHFFIILLQQVTDKILSNLEDTQDDFLVRQIEHLSSKMPYRFEFLK